MVFAMPVKQEPEERVEDSSSLSEDEAMEEDASNGSKKVRKAYLPGISRPLKEGEEWEFDPEAYRVFHTFETGMPCLSFDIVHDRLGENRTEYPFRCFLVAGTQGEVRRKNELLVLKLSDLYDIKHEDDDSSDEEEEDEKRNPKLHAAVIPHDGGINRIRVMNLGNSSVCAVWNDLAKVQLWNVTTLLNEVDTMEGNVNSSKFPRERPLFSCVRHKTEGFAVAWSKLDTGTLASGDNRGEIYIWKMGDGGHWSIEETPYASHTGSVEDVVWSPSEQSLLASCSSDRCIKLWDTRSPPKEACVSTVAKAHESDVNVLSWNSHEPIFVSGGDDATLNVWSLKTIQYGEPVARFKHHRGPITSVDWCPHESTTMIASGEDDQVSIWDLAVEADGDENIPDVPPQLLFVHMGQKEVKEAHFHSQIPGLAITTALTGFNVFKTINV